METILTYFYSVVAPEAATERQLTDFHDSSFVKGLRTATDLKY